MTRLGDRALDSPTSLDPGKERFLLIEEAEHG